MGLCHGFAEFQQVEVSDIFQGEMRKARVHPRPKTLLELVQSLRCIAPFHLPVQEERPECLIECHGRFTIEQFGPLEKAGKIEYRKPAIQVFPPFQNARSAPQSSAMLIDLLKEFVLELVRAFFLEELCQRVKGRVARRAYRRRFRRHEALMRWLHSRHRERLLHRLTTGGLRKL